MSRFAAWAFVFSFCLAASAQAKVVHYDLTITRQSMNLSGKKTIDFALAVNGGIPAPLLEFTEGDTAEILVRNRIPGEEASVHWHGILLPPDMDGVPNVSNVPIRSGEDFLFRFAIRQNGTYWYHSHTMTQEQEGVYGPIVIHPKKSAIAADREVVAMISDWSDEGGESVLRHLKKDGDYYLQKKGTQRSWLGAIRAGKLGVYLGNEWTRMGAMDLSDVGYDAFLMNGKRDFRLADAKAGEKVRIRIINAGSSSYFRVALGGGLPMKVISADGVDIEPIEAKEILMGMAETYDVLFQVPEGKDYELRASAQDGTGLASGWIGSGEKVFALQVPAPDLYASMDHGAHGMHSGSDGHSMTMDRSGMDMSHMTPEEHRKHLAMMAHGPSSGPVETLTVDSIRARASTAFPASRKVYELKLVLGGDMSRYVWFINGKSIHEERTIEIEPNDIVRLTFENGTMMHHPMHLHGHFFRVLTDAGDRSPLKHTVDVPPHGTRTIEFLANEPGEWMLHCHNLYHMSTGMARVVKYSSFTPAPEIAHLQHHDHHMQDPTYFYGDAEAATNHAQAHFRFSRTRDDVVGRFESRNTTGKNFSFREDWEIESDLFYRRWLDNYLHLLGGATLFDERLSAAVGVGYRLPLLIESQAIVDHRKHFRLGLDKRFQWAESIFSDANFTWRPRQANHLGHALEYEISLMYGPSWSWAAGLMLTDRSLGAGLQVRF